MSKPNIIIMTVAEGGWHLGCYGNVTVNTPNLDRMGSEGARFDKMHSSSSISSPGRVSLMTGQYQQHHGMIALVKIQYPHAMLKHDDHLSHVLRNSGYTTSLFGFQHEAHLVEQLGFDTRNRESLYGEPWQWGDELDPRESYQSGIPPQAHVPATETGQEVADYIRTNKESDKPFYCQIGFDEAYLPYIWGGLDPDSEAPVSMPSFLTMDATNKDGLEQQFRNFEASIARVDQGVGIILDALEETGQANDTIIIFTSDHGPEFPRAKWSAYENGTRVSFLMRWPGGPVKPGTVVKTIASQIDVVPTLQALAGFDVPHDTDGESFAGALEGQAWTRAEPAFAYNGYCRNFTARSEHYRYIRTWSGVCFNKETRAKNSDVPALELYDHRTDPDETVNLIGDPEHAEAQAELDVALWDYLISQDTSILQSDEETDQAKQCRKDLAAYRGE